MAGVNKVILVGNLGKDPEVRTLEGGKQVASFSIATSKEWKDREGLKQSKTEWHNIVVWEKLAEIAEKYLEKGSKIYLEGELQTRSWEKDGVTRYTTEIVGRNLQMLGSKQESQNRAAPATSSAPTTFRGEPSPSAANNDDSDPDDLPF